jgi:hypothetical protein
MKPTDKNIDKIFDALILEYESGGDDPKSFPVTGDFGRSSNNICSGVRYRLREYEGLKLKTKNDYDKSRVVLQIVVA